MRGASSSTSPLTAKAPPATTVMRLLAPAVPVTGMGKRVQQRVNGEDELSATFTAEVLSSKEPLPLHTFNMWKLLLVIAISSASASLRPQDSETRETKSLDGVWKFKTAPELDPKVGFQQRWFARGLGQDAIDMPVPSSFNDITQDA